MWISINRFQLLTTLHVPGTYFVLFWILRLALSNEGLNLFKDYVDQPNFEKHTWKALQVLCRNFRIDPEGFNIKNKSGLMNRVKFMLYICTYLPVYQRQFTYIAMIAWNWILLLRNKTGWISTFKNNFTSKWLSQMLKDRQTKNEIYYQKTF